MTLKEVKVHPRHFKAILEGELSFIVRYEDEDGTKYRIGDLVRIREWDLKRGYTGSAIMVEITYCFRETGMVIPGTVILSLRIRIAE